MFFVVVVESVAVLVGVTRYIKCGCSFSSFSRVYAGLL